MSRARVTLVAVLVGIGALTACSSSSDKPAPGSATGNGDKPVSPPAPKPITKDLTQAQITQSLLGDGEMLPGYSLHGNKSVTEGQYCNGTNEATDSAPAGWVRGGDSSYEYNGSTINMAFVDICLFKSADDAHRQYTTWKGTETSKQQNPKRAVGDENVLVINPGASDDSVYGYVRSGKVNIRVGIDGAAGDPSGAQAMLAATLKRLQQLQDGNAATVTAPDEQAAARQ